MNRRHMLASFMLLAMTTPAAAKDRYLYGPPPNWTRYKELGDAAVRARLADPDVRRKLPAVSEWSVEWPNGYMEGGWRHGGKSFGYLTCARLRALTPVDGLYPVVNFAVVIDHDKASGLDISSRESASVVNFICAALVRKGMLPPAPAGETSSDLPVATMGVTIRPMPEGAYMLKVAPDGAGQRAGLTPGMVITRVNGIALGGMGPAMARVLESDAPRLDLDTATGGRLVVERLR